jgi:hypothetical protein
VARLRSPRVHLLLLLLVLCPVFLAGCETDDYGPIKVMQAMPESHLAPFPEATLLSQGSMPRRSSPEEGTTGAYVDRKFGTNSDFTSVVTYYQSLLTPLGWTGCCSVWQKSGFDFQIVEETPGALPSSQQGYQLVYAEILSENTDYTPPPATGQ